MEDQEKLYLGLDFGTQQVCFYDILFCLTFPVFALHNINLNTLESVY